jgi:Tfp pilus assembly protein PilN
MSQQINLFNPLFVKSRTVFSLTSMLLSLSGIVIVLLMLDAYLQTQVDLLDKQYEQGVLRVAKLAIKPSGLSPTQANALLQTEVEQLERKQTETRQLMDAMVKGTDSNSAGYSEYMRAFARQVVSGLWLTSLNITANEISLSGGVVSPELLPGYVMRLGQEPVLKGRQFATLQMQMRNVEGKKGASSSSYLAFTLRSAEGGAP